MSSYARDPHIQARLDAWAIWLHSSRGHGGAGHPLARLMEFGSGRRAMIEDSGNYRARIPINDLECELINRAVCALPTDLRDAVAAWHDRRDGFTLERVAAKLGIVRATLHRRLCQADSRIDVWLQARRERGACSAIASPTPDTF